jgi:hypothetical protein
LSLTPTRINVVLVVTVAIRFLEPIDPRSVAEFCAGLVNVPGGGFVHLAPGSRWNFGGDDYWPLNPHLEAEGDASVYVEYGNEGSPLIEDYSPFPFLIDDELIEMSGPRCYLQLLINGPGEYEYVPHSEWETAVLAWSPVRTAVFDGNANAWV